MIFPVKRLSDLGFEILATEGTAEVLRRNGVHGERRRQALAGRRRTSVVPMVLAGEIDLIFNTPFGVGARLDGYEIRTAAVTRGVPCITTIQGAAACVQGIEALVRGDIGVRSLQEHHATCAARRAGARRRPDAGPGAGRGPVGPPGRRLPRDDAGGARAWPS